MDENRAGCVCEEPALATDSVEKVDKVALTGCLFFLCLAIFLGCCLNHCRNKNDSLSEVGQILVGDHRLARTSDDPEGPSPYFVSSQVERGSEFGGKLTTLKVNFCWEGNEGTYTNSSLYLNQLRVKLDPQASEPSVKFYWRRPDLASAISDDGHQRWVVERYVIYALVTIRPEDWRVKVKNLPRDLPVGLDMSG